jgi:hypothetical protein
MKKKKSIIIILSAVIVLSTILSACSFDALDQSPSGTDASPSPTGSESEARIKELEAKIVALMQNQQISESESQKQITALKAELEALKNKKEETPTDSTDNESSTEPSKDFKYTLVNGLATITAVTSNEENIIIPSVIDGYRVNAIGTEALSSRTVKSITISAGIEKLDWFAFKNCPSLTSVSIPDSVSSIGYGAFDNASGSLIIRCSRDSFAHRYAQSYGLTYDIT